MGDCVSGGSDCGTVELSALWNFRVDGNRDDAYSECVVKSERIHHIRPSLPSRYQPRDINDHPPSSPRLPLWLVDA